MKNARIFCQDCDRWHDAAEPCGETITLGLPQGHTEGGTRPTIPHGTEGHEGECPSTARDEQARRIERALEDYERSRMRPKKRLKWSKVKQNGARVALRKPVMTQALRVWDDARSSP